MPKLTITIDQQTMEYVKAYARYRGMSGAQQPWTDEQAAASLLEAGVSDWEDELRAEVGDKPEGIEALMLAAVERRRIRG